MGITNCPMHNNDSTQTVCWSSQYKPGQLFRTSQETSLPSLVKFCSAVLKKKMNLLPILDLIIHRLPEGGGGYTVLPLSIRPSKIFFGTFFSATIDGRNLIFGHKLHIGIRMPYRGKRFWNHQIPTSCLPTQLVLIHIEHICTFFSTTIDG